MAQYGIQAQLRELLISRWDRPDRMLAECRCFQHKAWLPIEELLRRGRVSPSVTASRLEDRLRCIAPRCGYRWARVIIVVPEPHEIIWEGVATTVQWLWSAEKIRRPEPSALTV